MKAKNIVLGALVALVAALVAMGLLFCWNSPTNWMFGEGSHGYAFRQLLYGLIGLTFLGMAAMVKWEQWLKAAPWLIAVWLAGYIYVNCQPPICGQCKWLDLGGIHLDVTALGLPAGALLLAWLDRNFKIRPWMVVLALAAIWTTIVCMNPNRLARLCDFIQAAGTTPESASASGKAVSFLASQYHGALNMAHWFSGVEASLRAVPEAMGTGMMATSAIIFGKWFPALATMLAAVLAGVWVYLGALVADRSKRIFLGVVGVFTIVPIFQCLFQCLEITPIVRMSCTPLGYGGTPLMMLGLCLGIICALLREDAEGRSVRPTSTQILLCAGVPLILTTLALSALLFAPDRGRHLEQDVHPRESSSQRLLRGCP